MSYRPVNFRLEELVSPTIFKRCGDEAWALFDADVLKSLQAIRDYAGPLVVNNWHKGGAFKESGLREKDSSTGAPKSAHKLGRAVDIKPQKISVRELYDYILAHPLQFPLIRRIEDIRYTPTWLHIDTMPHNGNGIKVFIP